MNLRGWSDVLNGMADAPFGAAPYGKVDDSVVNYVAYELMHDVVHNATTLRREWLNKVGDPRRDIDDECGFPKSPVPSSLYMELFERHPIAKRIVEVLPKLTWKKRPAIYESEKGKVTTPFEKSFDELPYTLRGEQSWYKGALGNPFFDYMSRLDIAAGVCSYATLLLGIDDGRKLHEPVLGWEETNSFPSEGKKPLGYATNVVRRGSYKLTINSEKIAGRKLRYMRVLPETLAVVTQYETNPDSFRFGQPVRYSCQLHDPYDSYGMTGQPFVTRDVHYSRIVHVPSEVFSNEVYGYSRMRPCLNDLLGLSKLYGAGPEAYWKACFTLLSLESAPGLHPNDIIVDKPALKSMMENVFNGLQRWWQLTGLTAKSIAPQVVDPSPQVATAIEAICIVLGLPVRVFKGSERGDLASSQDSDEADDTVRERRDNVVTPRQLAPTIDRLIATGCLEQPGEAGWKCEWPEAEMNPLTQAQIMLTRTQAYKEFIAGNVSVMVPRLEYMTDFDTVELERAQSYLDGVEQDTADLVELVPVPAAEEEAGPV